MDADQAEKFAYHPSLLFGLCLTSARAKPFEQVLGGPRSGVDVLDSSQRLDTDVDGVDFWIVATGRQCKILSHDVLYCLVAHVSVSVRYRPALSAPSGRVSGVVRKRSASLRQHARVWTPPVKGLIGFCEASDMCPVGVENHSLMLAIFVDSDPPFLFAQLFNVKIDAIGHDLIERAIVIGPDFAE
jgi:hypothetical protein